MTAFVLGEALVDVVSRGDASVRHPGGSPLNVAVGLSRLGLRVVFHSSFGVDDDGAMIAQALAADGVTVTEGTRLAERTSVALARIANDGSAQYEFSIEWDPAEVGPIPPGSLVTHTGSIAAALEPGAARVERFLAEARATTTVTFDPNIRPALMGPHAAAVERVERCVALADVVKASDEDVRWLYPSLDVETVLGRWLDRGPALVVVTRGGEGALALSRSGSIRVTSRTTTVVDTIGAGDSFMAGLIAALADEQLLGSDKRDRLRAVGDVTVGRLVHFATRCAAITVSRAGANPPTRAELQEGD